MGDKTKIITVAGILTLIALPVLYTGVTSQSNGVLWLGFLLFGLGMVTPPCLRLFKSKG